MTDSEVLLAGSEVLLPIGRQGSILQCTCSFAERMLNMCCHVGKSQAWAAAVFACGLDGVPAANPKPLTLNPGADSASSPVGSNIQSLGVRGWLGHSMKLFWFQCSAFGFRVG